MSRILTHREITPRRPDCLAAQRGFELLNPRRKEWTSVANGASLCRAEIRGPVGPIRDPALLAMVPLRGFGGDGAWGRRKRQGSSNVAQQNPRKDQVCARQEP